MTKDWNDPLAPNFLVQEDQKPLSTGSASSELSKCKDSSGQQSQAMDTETIARAVHSFSSDTCAGATSEADIDSAQETGHGTILKHFQDPLGEETATTQSTQSDSEPIDEDFISTSATAGINEARLGDNRTLGPTTNDGVEESPFFRRKDVRSQVTSDGLEKPTFFKNEEALPEWASPQDIPSQPKGNTWTHWTLEQETVVIDASGRGMGRIGTVRAVSKLGSRKSDDSIKTRVAQL